MIDLNIDWLRNNYISITYFGVIGIQLKVTQKERLHFYTKQLPSFVSEEDVHNHRYDFFSTILYGNFQQDIFVVTEGHKYIKEKESCKKDIICNDSGVLCDIKLVYSSNYVKNSKYFIEHDIFHRVKADDYITLIERSDYKKDLADVIRPVKEEKICPFSKEVKEDELWEIVNSMIKKI